MLAPPCGYRNGIDEKSPRYWHELVNVRPAIEHDLLTTSNLLLSADGESDLTQTEVGRLLLDSPIDRDCGDNSYPLSDPRAGNVLPSHIRLPNDLSTGSNLAQRGYLGDEGPLLVPEPDYHIPDSGLYDLPDPEFCVPDLLADLVCRLLLDNKKYPSSY